MHIKNIAVSQYQRLGEIELAVHAPLLLIAGRNEAGKTSLADAIYHAFNNDARRVALKKEFDQLVRDGAKRGVVQIELLTQSGGGSCSIIVPSGKHQSDVEIPEVYKLLLDASRLPAMPPEERRKVLFALSPKRITGKAILEKLKEKGANVDKATRLGPVLLTGFEAAHTECKTMATESRGSWKALTGEAYGSKKAPEWKAKKPDWGTPEGLAALEGQVADALTAVNDLSEKKGGLDQRRKAWNDQQERIKALTETAGGLERAKAKLATDEATVAEWQGKVDATRQLAEGGTAIQPLCCPACSVSLVLKDNKLTEYTPPEKVADAQAKALLPSQEQHLRTAQGWVANDKTAVQRCEEAAAALAELQKNGVENPPQSELDDLAGKLQQARQQHQTLSGQLDTMKALRRDAEQADANTAKALGFHNDVEQWDQMAEWLAPSGIQAELMSEALKPYNDRLARTAQITGWDKVEVGPDMVIRVAGRAYSLSSVSAKWRVQAAMVEALAFITGEKTFMLDEVDVLDSANRMAFLKWMHTLATEGSIQTAIMIGTFKEPPVCPPTFQVAWLAEGEYATAGAQREAQPA